MKTSDPKAFLTPRQIASFATRRARLEMHARDLSREIREASGDHLHSQACPIGGLYAGGPAGWSGQTPCLCGCPQNLDDAVNAVSTMRRGGR